MDTLQSPGYPDVARRSVPHAPQGANRPHAGPGEASFTVRIISLADATERRQALRAHLSGWEQDWAFFDAATGLPGVGPAYDEDTARRMRGRPLLKAEIGCFQSHWLLWQELAQGAAEWMLIVEDDHVIDTQFPYGAVARKCGLLQIPLLRLSYCFMQPYSLIGYLGQRQLVRFRHGPSGLGCYLLSRGGARRLIAGVTSMVRPVDDEVDRYFEHGIPIFGLFPFPSLDCGRGLSTISGKAERQLSSSPDLGRFAYPVQRVRDKIAKEISHRQLLRADQSMRRRLAEIQDEDDLP